MRGERGGVGPANRDSTRRVATAVVPVAGLSAAGRSGFLRHSRVQWGAQTFSRDWVSGHPPRRNQRSTMASTEYRNPVTGWQNSTARHSTAARQQTRPVAARSSTTRNQDCAEQAPPATGPRPHVGQVGGAPKRAPSAEGEGSSRQQHDLAAGVARRDGVVRLRGPGLGQRQLGGHGELHLACRHQVCDLPGSGWRSAIFQVRTPCFGVLCRWRRLRARMRPCARGMRHASSAGSAGPGLSPGAGPRPHALAAPPGRGKQMRAGRAPPAAAPRWASPARCPPPAPCPLRGPFGRPPRLRCPCPH